MYSESTSQENNDKQTKTKVKENENTSSLNTHTKVFLWLKNQNTKEFFDWLTSDEQKKVIENMKDQKTIDESLSKYKKAIISLQWTEIKTPSKTPAWLKKFLKDLALYAISYFKWLPEFAQNWNTNGNIPINLLFILDMKNSKMEQLYKLDPVEAEIECQDELFLLKDVLKILI